MSANLAKVTTVELVKELKRRNKCEEKADRRTIFVGPPGCGKGTQAPIIKEE
jgi:adenylate kinase